MSYINYWEMKALSMISLIYIPILHLAFCVYPGVLPQSRAAELVHCILSLSFLCLLQNSLVECEICSAFSF